jgi:membrane fusion protein, multidrug efflux system
VFTNINFRPALPAVLVGLAIAGCGQSPSAGPTPPAPLAVRVAPIERTRLSHALEYVGTVRYRHEIRVRAQVAGSLVDLPHGPGSTVPKGGVLARVAADDLSARSQRTHYELERARAESDHACDNYETDRSLLARGVITAAAADASRKACDVGRASRKAARAQLAELRTVSARTVERAARDATVLEWLSEPGENVAPGQPLLSLGSGELEIEVNVVEEDTRAGLSTRTRVELKLDDKWTASSIARISPVASGTSRSVEVRVAVPDTAADKLRPGAAVDVRFVLAEASSALAVPSDAVGGKAPQRYVFVIDNDAARRHPVETGIRASGRVEILSPLPDAGRVAIDGLDQLRDGMPVFPVELLR